MRVSLFSVLLFAAMAAHASCPCEASHPCTDEAFAIAPQQAPVAIESMEFSCADCGDRAFRLVPPLLVALFLLPFHHRRETRDVRRAATHRAARPPQRRDTGAPYSTVTLFARFRG